jgi:hypothetical protein
MTASLFRPHAQFHAQRANRQRSTLVNSSTQNKCSREGGLPPLKIQLHFNLDLRIVERGQAALPDCVYRSLRFFSES